ncbi:hypothetical protein EJB05_52176, partial [Eragrostis curvula]
MAARATATWVDCGSRERRSLCNISMVKRVPQRSDSIPSLMEAARIGILFELLALLVNNLVSGRMRRLWRPANAHESYDLQESYNGTNCKEIRFHVSQSLPKSGALVYYHLTKLIYTTILCVTLGDFKLLSRR